MYDQALWTAAHHDLPVVFVILARETPRVSRAGLYNIDAHQREVRP
jgi:hypothetical protein